MDVTVACRDLNELHPKLKSLAQKLIEECTKQNIPIIVTETYRSVARQDYLYAQGRTRSGSVVTNAKGSDMSSYHQWRLAFDVCVNIRGKEYDAILLGKIGKIGQSIGLEWGGGWSGFKDTPHFQYTFGLMIQDLKLGKKPPIYQAPANISKPIATPTPTALPKSIPTKTYEVSVAELNIKINGKATKVQTVNIEGTNYIRLRDINNEKIKVDFVEGMPTIDTK
ncbi:MAG: M15 family metallopeptidase [Cellulosilyticaceae bacterium]